MSSGRRCVLPGHSGVTPCRLKHVTSSPIDNPLDRSHNPPRLIRREAEAPYSKSMSAEEAHSMKRDPQWHGEVRDVAAGLWIWRVVHPAWKPNRGWEPVVA